MFANIIIAEYVLFFLKYFDKLHEIKTKKLCNQSLQKLYCNMFKYALCTYRFINAFIISEIYQDVNLEHFQSGIKPPWRNRLARSAVNRKVGGSSPPGGEILFCIVLSLILLQWFKIIDGICNSIKKHDLKVIDGVELSYVLLQRRHIYDIFLYICNIMYNFYIKP